MTAGRKRKPTQFHVINGTDRPCRRNENEPIPEIDSEIPLPPAHLTDHAKVEWLRMSKVLYNNGLLTQLDYAEFEIYCQAWGVLREADELMKKTFISMKTSDGTSIKTGLIMVTKNGNVINSPFLNIANTARRDCHKFLSEFGMTPSSRTKTKDVNSQRKQNKFYNNVNVQAC
ncbi:MAG TPA: phage terminase small subunit P27 family [Patescibacteria group bacterium]|nr:phage terminase small subunit P27 family [Patescibacteria group bacterium]